MAPEAISSMFFPYKTLYDEAWDEEWAQDWKKITEIFDKIEQLEQLFNSLYVSVLRELSQQKLILDLKKYAYSLSKVIIDKYKRYD
ncbi:hypothetical protein [Candidatus Harpocratesius sp.]